MTVLDQQESLQRSFIETFESVENFRRMIQQHKYREVCLNLLIFLAKAFSNDHKDFSEKLKKTKDLMNQYKIKSPQESQKVLVSLSSSRLTPQQIDSKLNQQLSELELNRSNRYKEPKIHKLCQSCQQELHHHCEICNQVRNRNAKIFSANHVTQTLQDQIQINSVAQKNQERLIQHIPESVLKLQEQIEKTRGLQQKYQFTSSPPLNKDVNKPIIIYQPIIYKSEATDTKPEYYMPKTDSPQKHFKVMKNDKTNRTNQCVKQNSEIFVQNRYTSPPVGKFREQDSSITKSLDTFEEIMKHDQALKLTEQDSKEDIKKQQYTFNIIQRTELQTLPDQLVEEPELSKQVSEENLLAVTPKQMSSCIDLMKMNVVPQQGEKFKSNPTSPLKLKPQKAKANDRFNETKRFFLDYMPPKKPHDIKQTQQRPFNIITNQ